ncbi:MAG: MerR family transcriptional regulator [Pseudomonadota bacterium]
MLIGDVARRAGLSKDTIRHYEGLGLLHSTPRQAGSRTYRDYGDDTLERLSIIAFAKSMHVPLRDMVVPLNRALSDESTTEERRALVLERLADIDRRITDLTRVRDELRKFLDKPEKETMDARLKALGFWID